MSETSYCNACGDGLTRSMRVQQAAPICGACARSLRARVAELEERLADEFVTRGAAEERLAAWEPVVRAAVKWWNEQSRRSHSALTDAVVAIRPEHRPEVEEVER